MFRLSTSLIEDLNAITISVFITNELQQPSALRSIATILPYFLH